MSEGCVKCGFSDVVLRATRTVTSRRLRESDLSSDCEADDTALLGENAQGD